MAKPLSELLRPTALEDLVQPLPVIEGLRRSAARGRLVNLLLYGAPGLGKTSAARIVLKMVGAQMYEINGSLQTGVDVIRKLEPFVNCASLFGKEKAVFIDECEYLSANAQAGLRGQIEKVPEISYLLTANDIKKLHPALKSRCMPVSFDVSSSDAAECVPRMIDRYERRLRDLGLHIDRSRLSEIVHIYFPDLRSIANRIEFEAEPIQGNAAAC